TVTKIELAPKDPTKLRVTLDVKKEMPLPKDTRAVIFNASFMSGRAVRLDFAEYCSGDNCAESKSYLEGEVVGILGSMVSEDEIGSYIQTIGSEVDSLLHRGGGSDSSQMMANIQGAIKNLHRITSQLGGLLESSNAALQHTFSNLASITGNLESNNEKINSAISDLAGLSAQLREAGVDQLIQNTDATVKSAGAA